VYLGCVADLGLLPRDVRYRVQNFYAWVNDVELFVDIGHEWEALAASDREYVMRSFLRAVHGAIDRASEAIRELERLTDPQRRLLHTAVGR
jgi:hypothetical protein